MEHNLIFWKPPSTTLQHYHFTKQLHFHKSIILLNQEILELNATKWNNPTELNFQT